MAAKYLDHPEDLQAGRFMWYGSVQFGAAKFAVWDQRRFAASAHHQFSKMTHGGTALEASLSNPTLKLGRAVIDVARVVPRTTQPERWRPSGCRV